MPCYAPLKAWYSKDIGASGKRGITFDRGASFSGVSLLLPCGQCIGCRLARSLHWAVRCMHEKQMHVESSFVTLTYGDEYLPTGGTLVKRDVQLFMKRLRDKIGYSRKLRFFMCGEYGERTRRPHYHFLFLNFDFKDKKFYKQTERGERLYSSELLRSVWPVGHNVIGDVTLESSAYVARYICDKITGEKAEAHYAGRLPEFTNMSRRPGIASDWYKKYGVHSHESGDFVVLEGKRIAVPRFYDNRFEVLDSAKLVTLKKRRRRKALMHRSDNTPERRRVREKVQIARLAQARRDYET